MMKTSHQEMNKPLNICTKSSRKKTGIFSHWYNTLFYLVPVCCIDNKKTYNSFVEIQLAKSQIIHIIITSTTNKKRPLSFHVKWRRRKSETEIVHIYFPPPSFISVTISQQQSAIKKSELIRTEDVALDNLMKLDSQTGMTELFLIQNIVFTKSKTLILLNPKYWFY